MNACDDVCIVCGEPSKALICRECQALIGAKPLRAEPTEALSVPAKTRVVAPAA